MNRIEINNGSKTVIALRNSEGCKWNARLYVGKELIATLMSGKFKTEAGLRRWAKRVMAV